MHIYSHTKAVWNLTDTVMVEITVLISLCFLLTSSGWLVWAYHLPAQMSAERTDMVVMVAGYLFQAVGIGIFSLILRRKPAYIYRILPVSLGMHAVCMIPAAVSPVETVTLITGFLMNIFCGIIAGYYLYELTINVLEDRRASVFGIGYALSIAASWLLSLIDEGAFYYSEKILAICAVLTGIILIYVRRLRQHENTNQGLVPDVRSLGSGTAGRKYLCSVCLMIVLFGIVYSCGFSFPTEDIGKFVNVELSRMVYAAGLIIAGFITDRSRKYGALLALTALIIPFIIHILQGEILPRILFWVLSYFFFGFYSIFRVILFTDIASDKKIMFLSGAGLLFGRIGDAAGEGICIAITDDGIIFVCIAALFFGTAVFLFFQFYPQLYLGGFHQGERIMEKVECFVLIYDLTVRERDVLLLILKKMTNEQIAESLAVSENTVKTHMRNLLRKTGCSNRKELIGKYMSFS